MASLRLLHLNEDTSWLIEWKANEGADPFRLVIDPWLTESQVDFVPVFSKQSHVVKPAFDSIKAIEDDIGPVSAIFNTVEYTDHTHEATLRTAKPETPVFARHSAKKRIDKWKIFDRPVATVRQYNPKVDISNLPDTLVQLADRAEWSQEVVGSLPQDVSLLWIPTDDWLDGTRDALHGVAVIKFDIQATEDGSQSAKSYTVLYSPHGVPATAVAKVFAALNALPDHTCLALIHHFDDIYIPILGGSVFRGLQGGADLAMATKSKYWFRTHDELKTAEGLISKLQRRVRNTTKEAQDLVSDDIKVVELANGESFDLL